MKKISDTSITHLKEKVTMDSYEDCEIPLEADFVGRDADFEKLQAEWKKRRIIGIYGIRSVGKSRFATELIKRCRRTGGGQLGQGDILVDVDLSLLTDIGSLYTNIFTKLGLEHKAGDLDNGTWLTKIVCAVQANVNRRFIFFFDNTEEYQDSDASKRDLFLSLCTNIVKRCKNAKTIITSTTSVQLSQLKRVYLSHELLAFNHTESLALLNAELENSGIVLGEHSDALIRLTEGLPLLILMVTSELSEDEGMITPKVMVELLEKGRLKSLSREFYPEDDRVADVYQKFVRRLSAVYRRRLSVLQYIPGSFTPEQAQHMLDFPSVASVMDKALIQVRRRHYVQFDPVTRRFTIPGILRECLETFVAIQNIPEIRTRYVKTFARVMAEINTRLQLGSNEYSMAITQLSLEQPNMHKLLQEVRYNSQDTYQFFMHMVTDSTYLIETYMSGDGELFYERCRQAAVKYGGDTDIAAINIAVGSLYTNAKGDFAQGETSYRGALAILKSHGKSHKLALAYQKLGWNLIQQGKCADAITYLEEALSMSSGAEYQMLSLVALNCMGVAHTKLGLFEESERYHFMTLDRRRQIQGQEHPSVGATLNNIGLMYDQKGDRTEALKYFLEGLDIKQKAKAPDMSLINSLCNVANAYVGLGRTSDAHESLDEAQRLLESQPIIPADPLAYLYDNRGLVFLKEGQLDKAREMIEKGVEKRQAMLPDTPGHCESLLHLVRVMAQQQKTKSAVKLTNEILNMKDSVCKAMPHNQFIKESLECLAEIYARIGDSTKYRETLGKIESELMRLENVFLCECNDTKLENIHQQLLDIRAKL